MRIRWFYHRSKLVKKKIIANKKKINNDKNASYRTTIKLAEITSFVFFFSKFYFRYRAKQKQKLHDNNRRQNDNHCYFFVLLICGHSLNIYYIPHAITSHTYSSHTIQNPSNPIYMHSLSSMDIGFSVRSDPYRYATERWSQNATN